MALYDPLDQTQAQAQPTEAPGIRAVTLHELPESDGLLFGSHPLAAVGNRDLDSSGLSVARRTSPARAGQGLRRDSDLAALRRKLHGIVDQFVDGQGEPAPVAEHVGS